MSTPAFDYFLQTDKIKGVRRYPRGEEEGERWDRDRARWTHECAPRRACELTGDRVLSEKEAAAYL